MPPLIDKEPQAPPEDSDLSRTNVILTEIDEDDVSDLPLGFKPVKLTSDQATEILELVTKEIDRLYQVRQDLGLEEEWRDNQDQYDGILPPKEYPSEHSSNFNVPITADKVDTLFAQTEKAMFFMKPIIGIEPAPFEAHEEEPGIDVDISEKKEEFLDFVMVNEVPVKEGSELSRFQACLHGTGWMRCPFVYLTEPQADEEIYKGRNDLEKFIKNYPDPEAAKKTKSQYEKYLKRLLSDETVSFEVEYDAVIHNGPLPRSIDIFDFLIDPLIRDAKKAQFTAEKQCLFGDDILREVENKIFRKDVVEQLQNDPRFQTTENIEFFNLFPNTEFDVYEVNLKHSFKKNEQQKRYKVFVLYDREKAGRKALLQMFHYPWWHNRWDAFPVYISPKRRKGIYRDGLALILRDSQLLANIAHDIMLDSAITQVVPSWRGRKSNKKQIAGEISKGFYAGVIYWLDNPETDLIPNEAGGRNLSFMANIQANAERMADLRSGITAGLSGRELPQDPNAPGNKTAALIQQSNIRIGPALDRLQETLMRELAYQIIQLYYQFKPSGVRYKSVDSKGLPAFPTLTRDELRRREYYTPMGTAEILDSQLQDQKDQLLLKLSLEHPDISQRPKTRFFLLEQLIKHLGTQYSRKLRKILPSEEELMEEQKELARQAVEERVQQEKQDKETEGQVLKIKARTNQLLQDGLTPEQAKAAVSQEFGIKGNGAMQ